MSLSTPKKKKKWVIFEDQENLQERDIVGDSYSLKRGQIQENMLSKYEGGNWGVSNSGGLFEGREDENRSEVSEVKVEKSQRLKRFSECFDGNSDESPGPVEKVFFLMKNPIRGFKY